MEVARRISEEEGLTDQVTWIEGDALIHIPLLVSSSSSTPSAPSAPSAPLAQQFTHCYLYIYPTLLEKMASLIALLCEKGTKVWTLTYHLTTSPNLRCVPLSDKFCTYELI